jgi:hypothetical protein
MDDPGDINISNIIDEHKSVDINVSDTNITLNNNDVPSEDSECVICRDTSISDEYTHLPCAHKFHTACINRWLVISRTCPLCKHQVSPEIPPDNLIPSMSILRHLFIDDSEDIPEFGRFIQETFNYYTDQPPITQPEHTYRSRFSRVPHNQVPHNQVPHNQVPLNQVPLNQVPHNQVPQNQVPHNQVPHNQVPQNQIPLNQVPHNQVPHNQVPQNQIPLNQIPHNSPDYALFKNTSLRIMDNAIRTNFPSTNVTVTGELDTTSTVIARGIVGIFEALLNP